MAEGLVSLDTNILVYAADIAAGDKHDIAVGIVDRLTPENFVLTQQVVGELFNVARRSAPALRSALAEIIDNLLLTFTIAPTPIELLRPAFDRSNSRQLQFWDSVIVTVCLVHSVEMLISEDMQDGMKLDGLTVINPFNPSNADVIGDILLG